jgi:CheY-like chemotaxis protein
MKKILLIEDQPLTIKTYISWFKELLKHKEEKPLLLFADSVEEAQKVFRDNPDISVIVFDGSINGPDIVNPDPNANPNDPYPNSVVLVYEFRKTTKVPFIAASVLESCREVLKQAGCDYECDDKNRVPHKVIEILGLG